MKRTILFSCALFPLLSLVHCEPSSTVVNNPDGGPASTCPVPAGPGVEHSDTITANETWRAADGPHIVTFGIKVAKGATLTIEPCADVRLRAGYSIVVEGNLVAEGSATQPIKFEADDAAKPWGYLQVFAPGTMKLAYVTASDGGGESTNALATIEARGDQLLPSQEVLKVDHVTVTGSADYGVSLRYGAAFTSDSNALTIKGSKKAGLRITPRLATNVPAGDYTGNGEDAIVVETDAYAEVNYEDVTFHDRGVPYHIGAETTLGELRVGPKHFTLTIEPGVTFRFKKNGVLRAVDDGVSTGVIVAAGTVAKPIVFTSASASPAAGDWVGIQFGKVADASYKLDHVEVRYAGGDSQASGAHCYDGAQVKDDASVAIYHEPLSQYVTNSLIADSPSDGINNAYAGAYYNFKTTNTFQSIAICSVTQPRPKTGVCPKMLCP